MKYKGYLCRLTSLALLILGVSMVALENLAGGLAHSYQKRDRSGNTTSLAQMLGQPNQATKPQTGTNQAKTTKAGEQKKDAPGQESKQKSDAGKEPSDKRSVSPEEKRQQALLLVDEALAVAKGINQIECKVLAQVEGAALLWPSDQARARSILQEAVNAARQFLEEEKKTRVYKLPLSGHSYEDRESRSGRLWSAVLRKVAAINPTLLQELVTNEAKSGKANVAIERISTEEARAMISLAYDQIEQDPAAAVRLAEQTLAYGMVNWGGFLATLSQHDPGEAERLGKVVIDRLRDRIYPSSLWGMNSFFLAPARSAALKEYFLQAQLISLRRDLRPDINPYALENDLATAQYAIRAAAKATPRLQPEFERIASDMQELLKSLAVPLPTSLPPQKIDMPQTTATPGNTNEVRDAATPTDNIAGVEVRDQKYKKLAIDAALKADVKLAEDMLWRISNEELRRETTLEVYSPLVRKAFEDADWGEVEQLALKIAEPLGRTLILNELGQRMQQAKKNKALILEVYQADMACLEKDKPTVNVAKAWLLLLPSLFKLDPENSYGVVSQVIPPVNKLAGGEDLFKDPEFNLTEPKFSLTLSNWVGHRNVVLTAGEVVYLPELLSKAFGEMARQDEDRALKVTVELVPSLRPLAQLAVSREMLEQAKSAAKTAPKDAK